MAPASKESKAVEKVKSVLGGTEVVTIDSELTSAVVLSWLRDPASVPHINSYKEDPEVVAARIAAGQLGATSADELFGDSEVLHGKDVVGRPLQFLDVHYQASDIEGEGLPFYGVYSVATADGESKTLTCGAKSVVLKLAKADAEGWLPLWLKITRTDKPTPAGYYPFDIVKAAGPDVRGGKAF